MTPRLVIILVAVVVVIAGAPPRGEAPAAGVDRDPAAVAQRSRGRTRTQGGRPYRCLRCREARLRGSAGTLGGIAPRRAATRGRLMRTRRQSHGVAPALRLRS